MSKIADGDVAVTSVLTHRKRAVTSQPVRARRDNPAQRRRSGRHVVCVLLEDLGHCSFVA
jgi:hypothetical protein